MKKRKPRPRSEKPRMCDPGVLIGLPVLNHKDRLAGAFVTDEVTLGRCRRGTKR